MVTPAWLVIRQNHNSLKSSNSFWVRLEGVRRRIVPAKPYTVVRIVEAIAGR